MSEKQKENGKVHLKGQLRLYMQWPAVMALLLVAMNIWIYRIDRRAGSLMFVFVLIYIMMVGILYLYSKSIIMKDLVEFAAQYGIVQNTLLKELAVPYAILLDDGKAIWMNNQFQEILGGKPKGESYISKYIPELNKSIFPKEVMSITRTGSIRRNFAGYLWRDSAIWNSCWRCRWRRNTLSPYT